MLGGGSRGTGPARALAAIAALALLPCRTLLAQDRAREGELQSVDIEELSPAQVENLVAFGKVWGFLKYHHPLVTSGQLDWDAELFRELPLVLDAPDRAAGDEVLLEWAHEVGEPEPCKPCAEKAAHAYLQPALDWIADEKRLGAELSAYLRRVHDNRAAGGEQHY